MCLLKIEYNRGILRVRRLSGGAVGLVVSLEFSRCLDPHIMCQNHVNDVTRKFTNPPHYMFFEYQQGQLLT